MSDREFTNKYPDYDGTTRLYDKETGELKAEFAEPLIENFEKLLSDLEKKLETEIDWNDISVYTGVSGIALLYLHLSDMKVLEGKQDFLAKARTYMDPLYARLKKKHFTFLCGVPGPLAIGAAILLKSGFDREARSLVQRLENLDRDVLATNFIDELLYGRSGFLFSLLFIRKQFGKDRVRDKLTCQIVAAILKSGKYGAKKFANTLELPLYYEWHDKAYIGAAHGFIGILYMLLQARNFLLPGELDELVKPSIDGVLTLQFPSGNFPSSLGNNSDKLIHWCHGAPGAIHLFILAYQVFSDEKYLAAAKKCSDVIWKRGLLRKGYGICHGVSGNGYAHLRLFQVTKEEIYLHRALKFAEWCFDYGKHECRIADRPLSLFEGLAGTVYFLSDLLEPMNSAFPAFQLHTTPLSKDEEGVIFFESRRPKDSPPEETPKEENPPQE